MPRAIILKYKPEENLDYLADRTFICLRKHKNNKSELLHERAIITYGTPTFLKNGGLCLLKPNVTLLTVDERGKGPKKPAFTAVLAKRYPVGMPIRLSQRHCSIKKPLNIDVLSSSFDIFPIFTKKPVKIGESWTIQIIIHAPKTESNCICPVMVRHRLEELITVGKIKQALVSYKFYGAIETADHPKMLKSEIHKRVKPRYTFTCHGTAHFNLERGIIIKKEQCVEWTKKWTDILDMRLVKWNPSWELNQDWIYSTRIMVELIPKRKIYHLIKMAEKDRIAYVRAKATKCVHIIPQWKYLVEKRTAEEDNNGKNVFACQAFVYYGSGAREMEGQFKVAPNVVYIDENRERLPKTPKHGPVLMPRTTSKMTLIRKSSYNSGITPEFPIPVCELPDAFDTLPLRPTEELKSRLSWIVTLYAIHSWKPELTFPIIIRHKLTGYEQKDNRRCAVIQYLITGEFKANNHPERLEKEDLSKNKLEIKLRGNGLVYFDQEAGIVIEKQQTISIAKIAEHFEEDENKNLKLTSSINEERLASIHILLQPN